jgi:predicted secreted hydrolase
VLAPNDVEFVAARRWRSPRTGVDYPVAMNVRAGDLRCALEPLIDDQELDARAGVGVLYWEGAVRATERGRSIGRGYLELTGYGKPIKL